MAQNIGFFRLADAAQGLVDTGHANVDRGLRSSDSVVDSQLLALRIEQIEKVQTAGAVLHGGQLCGMGRGICLLDQARQPALLFRVDGQAVFGISGAVSTAF